MQNPIALNNPRNLQLSDYYRCVEEFLRRLRRYWIIQGCGMFRSLPCESDGGGQDVRLKSCWRQVKNSSDVSLFALKTW